MQKASDELRFEDAAIYRDRLESLKALRELQRVTVINGRDLDMVFPVGSGETTLGVGRDGLAIDLQNGHIDAYNFKLTSNNIYLNSTDNVEYKENIHFKETLKENLNNYIIDIKELG